MFHPNTPRRKSPAPAALVLLCCALLAPACGPSRRARDAPSQEERARQARASEQSRFEVSEMTAQVLLAVEVSVTADGVRALGASVIRSPARANSARPDLRVTAWAGDTLVSEYTMSDPRFAEVGGRERRVLPEVRTFVFAPLSEGLTGLRVEPLPGREGVASKGGALEVRDLARRACESQPEWDECRRVLNSKPLPSPSPPPPPRATPRS